MRYSRLLGSIGVGTNDGLHSPIAHFRDDFVRVVSSVGNECRSSSVVPDDLFGDRGFVLLARRDFDVERATVRVDGCVQLRGEATSRVPQCIDFDPPFPPEASWCARTTEASMMQSSSSTSNCSALRIFAQVPRCDHALNRL
jgi:hypothetical protein